MPRFQLFAAAVLVLSYSTAIALPCRSADTSGRGVVRVEVHPASGAHTHAHHEHAAEADEPPCHEPPAVSPVCSCGCDQKNSARTPGGRLDESLFAAAMPVPPAFATTAGSPPPQRAPASIVTLRDKIPIRPFSPIRS